MLNLLQPDAARITPAEHKPTHDRAQAELALGTAGWLRDDLIAVLGEEQVHSRVIDLVKYATHASAYRMFPNVVVSPRTVDEVAKIFAYAQEKRFPSPSARLNPYPISYGGLLTEAARRNVS